MSKTITIPPCPAWCVLPAGHEYDSVLSKDGSALRQHRAYYAHDLGAVCRFLEGNAVDYLVIDHRHFSRRHLKRERLYFEPFSTEIRKLTGRRGFALAEPPRESVVFSHGPLSVVTPGSLGCEAP